MHETRYEVQVHSYTGQWVRVGPLHPSMTDAELWAMNCSYLQNRDYRVIPTTDD